MRPTPPLFAVLLTLSLVACSTAPSQPSGQQPTLRPVGAAFNIRFSGLGTSNFDANISTTATTAASSGLVTAQGLTNQQTAVTPVRVTFRGSLDIIPPIGQPRTDGFRYVYATVSVTSSSALSNVSFLGVRTSNARPISGGNDTAISEAIRAPGGLPYSDAELLALVLSVKPTQASALNSSTGQIEPLLNTEDTVQYLPESALSFVPAGMVGLLPYGFTVLHRTTGGRVLSTTPEANQMIIGMKVPLAASAADDPSAFSFTAIPVSDSETRVTQSLEAQTPAGSAAVVARAAALGVGTTITMLPSLSPAPDSSNASVALCSVRTAGPVATPTAYLVNLVPSTISGVTRTFAKGQTLTVNVKYTDADNTNTYYLPAKFTLANSSLGSGSDGALTANAAGTTSATLSACGSSISGAPVRVLAPTAQVLAGGFSHSLAVISDGTVAAWGDNTNLQRDVPVGLTNATAVSGGQYSSFALTSLGKVQAWGYRHTSTPTSDLVAVAALTNIVSISAGNEHGLALDGTGAVFAWGLDSDGQATVPNSLGTATAIAAGGFHSLALKNDGTVVAWGLNTSGQTVIPSGLNSVVAISGGDSHSLALKNDGTVVAWGSNTLGQRTIPSGLNSVVAISAGGNHNLAIKSDGSVVAWGSDGNGQATVPSNGLTDVLATSASGDHSLALNSDGSIVGWGLITSGQITIPVGMYKLP